MMGSIRLDWDRGLFNKGMALAGPQATAKKELGFSPCNGTSRSQFRLGQYP